MTAFYLPVLKIGVAYAVSAGRRWSILEHMLLAELANEQHSVAELARLANLPSRMIVEALIALLRANWIEVRADNRGTRFSATPVGRKRVARTIFPPGPAVTYAGRRSASTATPERGCARMN